MNANMPTQRPTPSLVLTFVACYLLLVLFGLLTMWLLFSLRNNLISLSMTFRVNPWSLRALDNFGVLLLGLLWLMAFILVEYYFRVGVQKGVFWPRSGKIFLITGIGALVSQTLNWLL